MSENLGVPYTALSEWIEHQVGEGRRFKNPRRFSLAAGLDDNTVSKVQEKGRASPKTLVALARAARVPWQELFVIAGVATEEYDDTDLSRFQQAALAALRDVPPESEDAVLEILHVVVRQWRPETS